MAYTPKTEETLAKEGLMVDGEYDFDVVDTDDKPSKAGNDMFTLKLNVFDEDGNGHIITDYIALGSNFGERKLRHAASACGLIKVYESGKLIPSHFQGKSGRAKIKTQDGNADYPLPKNAVADYISKPSEATEMPPEVGEDAVPF